MAGQKQREHKTDAYNKKVREGIHLTDLCQCGDQFQNHRVGPNNTRPCSAVKVPSPGVALDGIATFHGLDGSPCPCTDYRKVT